MPLIYTDADDPTPGTPVENGDQVLAGLGKVYRYMGTTPITSGDLTDGTQDYANNTDWELVSVIDADGGVAVTAKDGLADADKTTADGPTVLLEDMRVQLADDYEGGGIPGKIYRYVGPVTDPVTSAPITANLGAVDYSEAVDFTSESTDPVDVAEDQLVKVVEGLMGAGMGEVGVTYLAKTNLSGVNLNETDFTNTAVWEVYEQRWVVESSIGFGNLAQHDEHPPPAAAATPSVARFH